MHIVRGLGTGGTEMTCLRLAQNWQRRFDQSVVAWDPAPRQLEQEFLRVRDCVLNFLPIERANSLRWARLRTIIRDFAPDAVIIHLFGIPHLIAASAARAAGVRYLGVKAGNPPPADSKARRRWRAILVASHLLRCPVMSCSHAVDRELRSLGVGLPIGSIPIPNGIAADRISIEASRARRTRLGRAPVIGMVGRLDTIKDHDTLLRAFSVIRAKGIDAGLWLIGDGALRASLEETALQLGIAGSTRFLGDRIDVTQLLGEIDVYAFSTTRDEGFGIALTEAMAAQVPIVASDVAACREVLADGDAGVIVPCADPNALALAMIEFLQNPAKGQRFVEAARARVRREYSIEACAERWEALLFPKTQMNVATDLECAS